MRLLAESLGGVLLMLSAIHVYWALGGVSAGAAVPSRPDGRPLFRPGPGASLAVAAALAVAAGLLLAQARVITLPLPAQWIRAGAWAVAIAFGARAIGEFRYVGLFRRVRGTSFARWDAWVFTPLCLAMAAGAARIATG